MAAKTRKGGRKPTPQEEELWRHAMRHALPLGPRARGRAPQVTPEDEAAAPSKEGPPGAPAAKKGRKGRHLPTPPAPPAPPPPRPIELTAPRQPMAGVDRRTAERLRKGRMEIEGRIDLHGLTQAEAHAALGVFLASAQRQGKRCVLVITGKGSARKVEEDWDFLNDRSIGVLKAAVPRWLNEPANRARIVAYYPAQPRHGGGGALYVLLKRARGDR